MAENTESGDAAVEPVQAKLGLVQILAIIGLVVVTQIVMKVVLDMVYPPPVVAEAEAQGDVPAEEEEEIPVGERSPANYLPLDPALVVNIRNKGKTQFLQTSIQLMTRDAEVFEAAKLHAPAIRSALIMQFSTSEYDELATLEGKAKLQEDARQTINAVLTELAGVEGVDAVYLTSLVFQ